MTDKLNENRERAKERLSTLKLIYVQKFAQTQNLTFGSIRFSKDYNVRRMNHCRAKVELSAESVQRTDGSNLTKKVQFIRRATAVLLPDLIVFIWFPTARARSGNWA